MGRPARKLTVQEGLALNNLRISTSAIKAHKRTWREMILDLAEMGVPRRVIAEAAGVHASVVDRHIKRWRKERG